MNSIKSFLMSLGRKTRVLVLALAVVIAGAGVTQAATTISTNMQTDGTLSVTGASTLTGLTSMIQASSTRLSVHGTAYFGGTATSTFDSAGNLAVLGTLNVTGATTLASTTATTMKVGQVGTGMTRIVSGYCVTASITIPATNASSTQTYANCTPSVSASVISSGDRVFVMATSSLPYYVVIQSASSTASGGLITVGLTNFSTSTSPSAAVYAFNFWAFQ